jgi:hypothetical protein
MGYDLNQIKMKKLIYFTGITCILFLGLYLNSCNKDTEVKSRKAMNSTTTDINVEKMNGEGVKVVCSGNCDGSSTATCGIRGSIVNGVNVVTCSCSGCTMTVTERENGITTTHVDNDGVWEVKYLKAFQQFMTTYYSGSYSIVAYELQSNEDNYIETYYFDTGNGIIQTVLVVGDKLGMKDKVTVYDCTGTCDCREIYNMNANTCSCSCNECSLRVETIKK